MQVTNRTLITGGADGTVRFWDIETSQPLHVIDLVRLSGVVEIGNDLKKKSGSSSSAAQRTPPQPLKACR